MTDVLLFFAPVCLVAIVGTLVLNRMGWRMSRVLLCVAVIVALHVVEFEIAWHFTNSRPLPLGQSITLAIILSLTILAPLILLLGTVGWVIYRRGYKPTAGIFLVLAFYVGGLSWLTYWIRTPHTPDLTKERAAAILQSRPEFRSQGHSASFHLLERAKDSSRDSYYFGNFSFVRNNGERVKDAVATFAFRDGHWAFTGYRWGPERNRSMLGEGDTQPQRVFNKIETPEWELLPDGRLVKYEPRKFR